MYILCFPLVEFPKKEVFNVLSKLSNGRSNTGMYIFDDPPKLYVFIAHSADVAPFEEQLMARVSWYDMIKETDLPWHILDDPGYLDFIEKNQ